MRPDLSRWPQADDLLDRALALPAAERGRFLDAEAGADPALRAALEAVLSEASRDDGFLAPGGALSGSLGDEIARALGAGEDVPAGLAPGTRFEHYEVLALVGRGGMGEVYRARDTRLQRDVALKVLPARFAQDPVRLARFRREAQVLATLSHPGIGAIFGIAESQGLEALVLEFVEGPTLADRIGGQALPLDEALRITRELVDAIEAAHARGILHRDLKPANIKLPPGGGVKVLDFGLAKLASEAGVPASDVVPVDITGLAPAVLLGTAPYMSPEQARGRAVDERADVWAFGCVLFEMLTGVRAFTGATPAEVLARVIEREPAFGLLPPDTPRAVRRLLRRCLDKDPRRRLGYIGDARLELDDAVVEDALEPGDLPRPAPWRGIAAVAAALVLGAVAGGWWNAAPPRSEEGVARFVIPLPEGLEPALTFQPMPALSPDGRTLVFRALRDGRAQLYRRDLSSLEAVPIPGTEQATGLFFSPDGRWLGFDRDGVLMRVPMAGGPPVAIAPAPGNATASWADDDAIVFATNTGRVLQRVPVAGGTPEALTALDAERGDTLHVLPHVLPGARHVLYTIVSGATRRVAVLDLTTRESRVLVTGTHGRYLAGGFLVFWREDTLWGIRFDPARAEVAGEPVPLATGLAHSDNTIVHYDVAPAGALVYMRAREVVASRRLVWLDRTGGETPVALDARAYTRVALSPDGSRVALAVEEGANTDVWIGDPARGTLSRLTVDPTIETMPVWMPDGSAVAFRSEREGPGVFRRDAQGAGPIERLTTTDGPIHSPYSWTPDGRTLLLAVFRSFRSQAIASVTPPDPTVRVLLDGDFAQLDPHVSPDGRWLAYQSDESGQFEVYVRPYPDVEAGRWQVSVGGGTSPRWRADGRELFHYDGARIVATPILPGSTFRAGRSTTLVEPRGLGGRLGLAYAASPDGRRFLVIRDVPSAAPAPAELVFVLHWQEDVRTRLAGAP
ncbi:MAG: protein kinase [Vicinamibacterales bacterium]|nr:protein kinase [Vicinamibacterales bacterium]